MRRVLVANRGEIAVRVIRTLRRLGLESVAVYTDVDREARHVALADTAVALGPAAAYLDIESIVAAATRSGADALHPGYGFLSENAELARRCASAEVTFVGPPPSAIELMGDKIQAKLTVAAAGVPVVPGSLGAGLDDDEIAKAAMEVGWPVLLKPSAGGGGKGMRLVHDPSDLAAEVVVARREARAAFGDGTLMVERYVTRPRHIEMQILADQFGHIVSLGERECSLQRRHQKIVEESPSPGLEPDQRAAMSVAATKAAAACGYVNAGTIEFIVAGDGSSQFFFMEMNTRLQVEHPVTEMVHGLDLVEWQLRVAAGEHLPWTEDPAPRGHAVEARVYAEDPDRGFLPATGTIRLLREPAGEEQVRVDSALYPGLRVGTDYDPMLAKVIAWGPDRPTALRRLDGALTRTSILGVTNNVGFLRRLLDVAEVRAGDLETTLVERLAPDLRTGPPPPAVVAAAALVENLARRPRGPVVDPWSQPDAWRLSGPAPITSLWAVAGDEIPVSLGPDGTVTVGSAPPLPLRAQLADDGRLVVEGPDGTAAYWWARDDDRFWLGHSGDSWELTLVRETIDHSGPAAPTSGEVASPMPGTVLAVHVAPGDQVREGQPLLSVEAMKMEHVVRASVAGTVRQVLVRPGDPVKLDQPVASIGAVEP